MQRRAIEHDVVGIGRAAPEIADVQRPVLAVARIDGEGMVDGRQVDADLVRAAGARPTSTQRITSEAVARLHLGERRLRGLRVGAGDVHAAAAALGERQIDLPLLGQIAAHQREVDLLGAPSFEGLAERAVRIAGEREKENARRVAIEPVHDQRARRLGAHLRDQGLRALPAAGDGQDARRLVDGQHVLVAKEDAHEIRLAAQSPAPTFYLRNGYVRRLLSL